MLRRLGINLMLVVALLSLKMGAMLACKKR